MSLNENTISVIAYVIFVSEMSIENCLKAEKLYISEKLRRIENVWRNKFLVLILLKGSLCLLVNYMYVFYSFFL